MKRNDLIMLCLVGVIAAILSFVLSDAVFGSPKKNPIKVPVVTPISSTFPDVKNDDSYKTFFNSQAFDPTQLIQIGNNNNAAPFQNSSQ